MKFADFYGKDYPVISFELFPPRTEKMLAELEERLPKLISLGPSFITVTYGALGSTQERTLDIASRIKNEYGMETAHHLTCVGASRDQITTTLDMIRQHKIENIVALRGDPVKGDAMFAAPENGYDHANQLVEHIRAFGDFGIGVAGYPEKHIEAPDEATDLEHLKRKVASGADVIITQLYYDNRHFYHFVEQCRAAGIHQPIVPGLMPILSVEQIKRITGLCGATIPIQLLRQLENAGNDEKRVQEIGIVHTANQALELLDQGVPGIHFYVLNRHFHIAEIMERIKHSLP